MKYSLDCYIKTNNPGLRNAVKQVLLSIGDPRVWNGEYDYSEFPDIEDGIQACEDGSFIREHKCYHNETPSGRCEEETILRKN